MSKLIISNLEVKVDNKKIEIFFEENHVEKNKIKNSCHYGTKWCW